VGLLVDSLEPLKREASVTNADGVPSLATRFELLRAEISGQGLLPRRINTAWTRVLLTPTSPVVLAPDAEADLALVAASSEGTLFAARRIAGRPSILIREGL
jgi:hypothetical protein